MEKPFDYFNKRQAANNLETAAPCQRVANETHTQIAHIVSLPPKNPLPLLTANAETGAESPVEAISLANMPDEGSIGF